MFEQTMSPIIISILITMMLYPTQPKPIVMKLMHVDSKYSPLFNPNATIEQQATNELKRSMNRLEFLKAQAESEAVGIPLESLKAEAESKAVRIPAGIVLDEDHLPSVYFVQLQVGTPAINQSLVLDTGSKFPWIFSAALKDISGTYYDPRKSTTRTYIYCHDELCKVGDIPSPWCLKDGSCCYYARYGDDSRSYGFLVQDAISFNNFENYYNTLFGCDRYTNSTRRGLYGGIIGLGYGNLNMMSQWSYTQFSYCFKRNISDMLGEPPSGVLLLGSHFLLTDEYRHTTLEISGGHYYVTIKGIAVAAEYNLPLSNSLKVILDTGASVTYLPPNVVGMINKYVDKIMGKYFKSVDASNKICYRATLQHIRGLQDDVPLITLQFSSGHSFDIYPVNAFRQIKKEVICLAIMPSKIGIYVIGAIAQQDYAITYIPEEGVLNFQKFDCDRLR